MNVFAISDLHMSENNPKPMDIFGPQWNDYLGKIFSDWNARVAPDDIVLLPGDLSWAMYLDDAIADLKLVGELNGRKVLLRGNHDYWWKGIGAVRNALPSGMFAVQNDAIRISSEGARDVVVFGTRGWVLEKQTADDKRICLREVERLKLSILAAQKIRGDALTVCMMHYPPFNVARNDSPFTELISEFKPDAVVYGHLHGKDSRADLNVVKNGIPYYLTSCDIVGNALVKVL